MAKLFRESKTSFKIKIGDFLFKHRSFTPIPLMIIVILFFRPIDYGKNNLMLNLCGFFISIIGEFIRVLGIGFSFSGTSGRENYLRADNLNMTGIYSIVRNPLYIGNVLIYSGILVVFSNLFAILIFDIFIILQYYFIILSEEGYLRKKYGKDIDLYFKNVSRIVPNFKNYKKPILKFSLKKIIFNENDSIFNILMMLVLILAYKQTTFYGSIDNLKIYVITGILLIFVYAIIKILKKH